MQRGNQTFEAQLTTEWIINRGDSQQDNLRVVRSARLLEPVERRGLVTESYVDPGTPIASAIVHCLLQTSGGSTSYLFAHKYARSLTWMNCLLIRIGSSTQLMLPSRT